MTITLDEILAIPGNAAAYARLKASLASEKALAFVGAGASTPLYPLWQELLHQIADEALHRGRANGDDHAYWLKLAIKQPLLAAQRIRIALGEQQLAAFLAKAFGRSRAHDGNYFTEAQKLLLRLPFIGYITTNYDPGLLEARSYVRPSASATGYATWKDGDQLFRWLNGEIFMESDSLPILYAHGFYQRSDTILLDSENYRSAYSPGPYRRLIEQVWMQRILIFAGFSFSDPWLSLISGDILSEFRKVAMEPRHVAIVGLPESEPFTPEMRRSFVEEVSAEPLFYPIGYHDNGKQDHKGFSVVLESLATSPDPLQIIVSTPRLHIPQCWAHETTNDELYYGREHSLFHLTRWARDPSVRAIAITGMGGLGKTSLLGHWIKRYGGWAMRSVAALFFWSFYSNQDIDDFFAEFLRFVGNALNLPIPTAKSPMDAAMFVLRHQSILIMLDGMEVMQEGATSVGYGKFLQTELREFVLAASAASHRGLLILTSRFVFPDLTSQLGGTFRQLDLERLSAKEGSELLRQLGFAGSESERIAISDQLEGHPLALRILAGAFATIGHGVALTLWRKVFDHNHLKEDDPLERKMHHLLTFYQNTLPAERIALLGILSLFRTAVEGNTIRRLSRRLQQYRVLFVDVDDANIDAHLNAMFIEGVLTREKQKDRTDWTCHPVLRDHFRSVFIGHANAAEDALELLTAQPSGYRRLSVRELEPLLAAIDVLADVGEFKKADELFRSRLENGRVFFQYPSPYLGMRCVESFVGDGPRRELCANELGARRLGFFLCAAGLFARHVGETRVSRSYYEDAVALERTANDFVNLAIHLNNLSELLLQMGSLDVARRNLDHGLAVAESANNWKSIRTALSLRGYILVLNGEVEAGLSSFDAANREQQRISNGSSVCSLPAHYWADALLRLSRNDEALQIIERNREICEKEHWLDDVARCEHLLGRYHLAIGETTTALNHLVAAEERFRKSHMAIDLASVLLSKGILHHAIRDFESAARFVEDSLAVAGPRCLLLIHADCLVLRGRIEADLGPIKREHECLFRGVDDGEAALRIARQCRYAWAEREANGILRRLFELLGDSARAKQHDDYETVFFRIEVLPVGEGARDKIVADKKP